MPSVGEVVIRPCQGGLLGDSQETGKAGSRPTTSRVHNASMNWFVTKAHVITLSSQSPPYLSTLVNNSLATRRIGGCELSNTIFITSWPAGEA